MKISQPSLGKLDRIFFVFNRKASIFVGMVIVGLLIIDLLSSRQGILKFDENIETVYFVLTVVIGFGIGSWLLLGYVHRVTTDLRAKSALVRSMHYAVIVTQFIVLGILLFVIFDRHSEFLTTHVYTITSIGATVIMGIFSIKFFSWYGSSRKNLLLLLYALAATGLAFTFTSDFVAKTFLVQVIVEETEPGAVVGEKFPFKDVEQGRILSQQIEPETTTTFLVPNENKLAYHYIGLIPPYFSFFFRWAATSLTLRQYHHKMGGITFWLLISIPLVLYAIGKYPDLYDAPDELWQRIIYRIGSNGGNIMFGVALFLVARKMSAPVKDYLSIAAIGFTVIGIAFGISALQQTFGIAGHSLALLSAYLFVIGLYSAAVSISHDTKLRQSIRKSAEELNLPRSIGEAQMEQELEKKVITIAKGRSYALTEQSGVAPSVEEEDIKQYLQQVIEETKISSKKTRGSRTEGDAVA